MVGGLVHYVEPNWGEMGKDGVIHQLPLEDLSINVNLSVEVPVPQKDGISQQEGKKYIVTFSSDGEKTYTNLMQGSKVISNQTQTFLTTNYTEATYEDVKEGGTNEMFGISSIDIQYDAYYTPQVTIQFVDIRGTALFSPEEQKHPGIQGYVDDNIAGSFFRCFFVMPYPKFTLMVKGFFGQPVTYELTCSDFRAKFDSKTGNFNATAKLVGYQFSILGDISFNTMLVSPCSKYLGADYWDKQVALERFMINGKPMKKLHEMLNEWTDIAKEVREELSQTQEAKDLKSTVDKKSEYEAVKASYITLVNTLKDKCPHKDNGFQIKNVPCNTTSGEDSGLTTSCNCSVLYEEGNNFLWFGDDYEGKEQVTELYNKFNSEFINLKLDVNKKPILQVQVDDGKNILRKELDHLMIWANIPQVWRDSSFTEIDKQYEAAWNNKNIDIKHKKEYATKGCYAFDNGFLDYIDKLIVASEKNSEIAQNNVEKKQKELTLKRLDIAPTIYNVMKIIMAHLETLMYEMYSCHYEILKNKRTIGSVGIPMENYGQEEYLPPFPDVIVQEDGENGGTNNIQKWIGDVAKNIGQVEEINLINGLLEGLKDITKAVNEYEVKVQTDSTSSVVTGTSLSPLTVHDIYYSQIWSEVDLSDRKSMSAAILLRAMSVLGLYDEWGDAIAKEMGTQDAKLWKSRFPEMGTSIKTMIHNATYNKERITNDGMEYFYNGQPLLEKIDVSGSYDEWRIGIGKDKLNRLIPIQQIDTTTNSTMLEEMYLGDTQNEEKYCRCEIDKVLQNQNSFKIDKDIKKFVDIGQSHSIEDLKDRVGITNFKSSYMDWIGYNGVDCRIIGKKFNSDEYLVNYEPIEGSGLFGKTKDETSKLSGETIFNDDYGKWCDEKWGFEKLKCKKIDGKSDFLTRQSDSFDICFADKDYDSRISEYTIPMFRGVTVNSNGEIKAAPGQTLFTQPIYYQWGSGSENAIYRQAYLFLKTFETVHYDQSVFLGEFGLDVECEGFKYDKILSQNFMNESWDKDKKAIYMLPYIVLLYLGACFYLDSEEGKKLLIIGDASKENKSVRLKVEISEDYNLCPQTKEIIIKEFKNWVDNTYKNKIHSKYALNIKAQDKKLEDIIKFVNDEGEDKDNRSKIPENFANWFDDVFFEQYISFATGSTVAKIGSVIYNNASLCSAFRLCNRDTANLDAIMKELYSPCVVVMGNQFIQYNTTSGTKREQNYPELKVSRDWLEDYLEGFINELKNQYEQPVSDTTTPKVDSDASNDIKHSLYRYLKTIYDKWLCGNIYQSKNGYLWEHWTLENFFYPHFHFIDTFYNYTPQVLIDIDKLLARIVQSTTQAEYTLIEFISSICQENNMQIHCIQNFLDYNNETMMKSMFKPVPTLESQTPEPEEIYCDFVIIKQNEPSKQLEMKGVDGKDKNDGFMIHNYVEDYELPIPIASKTNMSRPDYMGIDESKFEWLKKFDDIGNYRHKIPCFGVAYGYQYQSYFTDIQVGMDNPIATEQSIKAEMNIIMAHHNKGDGTEQEEKSDNTKVSVGKQDLYSVYMNNSYSCEVTMLGCPWVQPLMYFCLLNIPMFRGCYLIHKVSHSIRPGDMKTKFTGTRIARHSSPIADTIELTSNETTSNVDQEAMIQKRIEAANADNDCEYKRFYPQYEKVNSSVIDIQELKNTTVKDFTVEGGWNDWFYENYSDSTVWDALVSNLYGEYGNGTDLDQKLVATTIYNRIMKGGGVHSTGLSKNVCTYMQYNGFKFMDKAGHKNIADRKSYNGGKMWDKCSKNLEYIFTNTPSILVDTQVIPTKPTVIYKDGEMTNNLTQTKNLTLEDVQTVYFYVNANWYEQPKQNGKGHREYDYLFHHNHHLFSTKNVGKCWEIETPKSTDKDADITILDKLNDIVKSIEETCANSPKLEIKTIVKHTISGNSNSIIVSPLQELKADKLNSKLYDVILNTYSKYLTHTYWLTKDSNSSKNECYGVLIGIADNNDGKKNIGVYYPNDGNINTTQGYTAVVDSITKEEPQQCEGTMKANGVMTCTEDDRPVNTKGNINGILNEQFYRTLGKYYGKITDSNINEFHDVKNYTNNNLYEKENHKDLINELLKANKVKNCDEITNPKESSSNEICGTKEEMSKLLGGTLQLSKRFNLAQLTASSKAKEMKLDNMPTQEHLTNLKATAEFLDKLIDEFIKVYPNAEFNINSSYRCPAVNKAVGGSETSQHQFGQAIDIDVIIDGAVANAEFFNFIKTGEHGDFGQLIWEFGNAKQPNWVHVSTPTDRIKNQVKYATKVEDKTKYLNTPWWTS